MLEASRMDARVMGFVEGADGRTRSNTLRRANPEGYSVRSARLGRSGTLQAPRWPIDRSENSRRESKGHVEPFAC